MPLSDDSFRSSRLDRVVVAGFLCMIWLPFVGLFVDLDPTPHVNENRRLAKLPGTDGVRISRTTLRDYLKDNIGFRDALVRTHGMVKFTAFRSASTPQVVVGKGGWLFNNLASSVAAYTGDLALDEATIDRWRSTLAQRGDFLADRHIKYGIVLVPDKHFVYPEFLPDAITQKKSGSYTQSLISHLHQPNVRVIELFDALRKAKPNGELFYYGDSHWNGRGIAAGYESILRQLGEMLPEIANDEPCQYNVVISKKVPGQNELYRQIGVESVKAEHRVHAKVNDAKAKPTRLAKEYVDLEPEYRKRKHSIAIYENADPKVAGRKLVMFHTSFSTGPIRTLLAEHFERCVFVRHAGEHVLAFHKLIVETEQPSIVLNEIPTRYLTCDPTLAYQTAEWSDSAARVVLSRSASPRRAVRRK